MRTVPGSGKYKGGQKVTVTAKDVDGSTFVKWEIDGKLSLTDEELSSQTISSRCRGIRFSWLLFTM